MASADRQPVGDPIPVVKASDGKYTLTLPPDLPVKPDSRLDPGGVGEGARTPACRPRSAGDFDLAAPVYVTHLDTDKPMYQPGEMVHYRSLTLDRFSLKPAEEDLRLTYELVTPTGGAAPWFREPTTCRDETGAPVIGPDKKPIRGVGAGEFLLDPNAGRRRIHSGLPRGRQPLPRAAAASSSSTTIPKPQLNKQLDFSRSTYGPGDEVSARCKAVRVADGEPVRNQPVEATVLIDDKKYGADGKETPASRCASRPTIRGRWWCASSCPRRSSAARRRWA